MSTIDQLPALADLIDHLGAVQASLSPDIPKGQHWCPQEEILRDIDDATGQGHKLTALRKLVAETSSMLNDLNIILEETP